MSPAPLIAVDVGNSRIKLGLFRQRLPLGLPEPETTLHLTGRLPEFDQLDCLAGKWLLARRERAGVRLPSAPLAHRQRQPPGGVAADRLAPRSSRRTMRSCC